MMANLAASLFAAEAIVTTEAKAKALAALRREAHHEGQEGPGRRRREALHQIRQIQGFLGDREMTHKLVNEVAPATSSATAATRASSSSAPARATAAEMARIELV